MLGGRKNKSLKHVALQYNEMGEGQLVDVIVALSMQKLEVRTILEEMIPVAMLTLSFCLKGSTSIFH